MFDLIVNGLCFVAGVVVMWFWYPYNLARHPEKIAALQVRAEKYVAGAQALFEKTVTAIRDAQKQ
jgi:hypothetical protein